MTCKKMKNWKVKWRCCVWAKFDKIFCLAYMWYSLQKGWFWVKLTKWILPMPRWPCEPHPATESASFSARPWLSLPPHAAASPFADAASLPEQHGQLGCGQRKEDMVGNMDIKKKETEKTKDETWKKNNVNMGLTEENHKAGAPDGQRHTREGKKSRFCSK